MTDPIETARALALPPAADRAAARNGPLTLATPCAGCRHPYNWHQAGACQVRDCVCTAFAVEDRAALRDRIAEALLDHLSRTADIRPGQAGALAFMPEVTDEERMRLADAVLAVLPGPAATRTAALEEADESPLSPDYSHEACGFHWHGRDGMDIPVRDGQPVCPRCELAAAERKSAALQRRRDEVGAECKRRGKRVLEQSEKICALEKAIDEVRRQLGAEILRAGQAEAELRRLAAEAGEPAAVARPDVQVWPLARVLAEVRCGSEDWPWEQEWVDLDEHHADRLAKLEAGIRERGITGRC
ncbi:hypothetical protein ABTX35_18930 [Streptomyces sp. NPDC096080]|uniref:hypothetical protein n=1 Tax=Streptomyces sp. NPDC096080 TaxID=3156693 RepID=UPI003331F754